MKTRREWLKLGSLALASPLPGGKPRIEEYADGNTKIAHRLNGNTITDDEMLFLQQIGLKWARVEFGTTHTPLDKLAALQKRFEKHGIRIFSGVHYAYRELDVQLGRPGRDKHIETYRQFLRDCGKLGIPIASYDFHPANTYTTNHVVRRGYTAREFNLADFRAKVEKQAFEREYDAEEIWSHYSYLTKAVLPVAEEAGVKLALHPDDPPIAKMNGVAKLFVHYDGYKRAEQISGGSKNWGLTFCAGTWMEGGDKMGKNVFEMIKDFGGRGKIFEVHFRNVSSPLPHFVETFPDDGYMDMYEIMKALRQVKFTGAAEPDHVPRLSGDSGGMPRAGTSYIISYMRALLRRANEEVG